MLALLLAAFFAATDVGHLAKSQQPRLYQLARAKQQFLAKLGKRIDDLAGEPEVASYVESPFSVQLNDAQAKAVQAKLNRDIVNYSDYLIIALENPALLKQAGVRDVADDVGKAAKDKNIEKLFHAREFAVRSLRTGLDGQLQLYFNDAQASFAADVDAAIAECKKAHGRNSP